jgi:hypothetical protein
MLFMKPMRDTTITRQSLLQTVVVRRDVPERKETSPTTTPGVWCRICPARCFPVRCALYT